MLKGRRDQRVQRAAKAKLRSLGFDEDDADRFDPSADPGLVEELIQIGVGPAEVVAWREAGLPLDVCLAELRAGRASPDKATTLGWGLTFPHRAERSAWLSTGVTLATARSLAKDGYRPIDVLDGTVNARRPPGRREVVVSDTDPRIRLPGDMPLPNAVARAVTKAGAVGTLRAYGFRVIRDNAQTRFRADSQAAVLFELRHGHHRLTLARVEETTEGGAILVTLPAGERASSSQTFRTRAAAVAGLSRRAAANGLQVRSILCDDATARRLLRDIQPIVHCVAKSAQVNGRSLSVIRDASSVWLLPEDPTHWPGAENLGDDLIALGDLVVRDSRVGPLPVGWFEDRDKALEAGRQTKPILEVFRFTADRRFSMYRLIRTDESLILDGDGRRRDVKTSKVMEAIQRSSSLHNVSANEATLINCDSGPSEDEIASALKICQQSELADEEAIWFPPFVELDDLEEVGTIDGISARVVVVNDRRWLAVPPGDGFRARLLPADPAEEWRLRPPLVELWAAYADIEWNSMVSGTPRWSIGLIAQDLVAEVHEVDEDQPYMAVSRRRPQRSRETAVALWLRDHESSLDLPMLAVESLIGSAVGQSDVPASLFDDNGSDTMTCDLWLNVETEPFLKALSRVGRKDAVDAVRRPGSDAAARRRARLPEDAEDEEDEEE
jgi:hypothetical protein